jgi:hypothetical protein
LLVVVLVADALVVVEVLEDLGLPQGYLYLLAHQSLSQLELVVLHRSLHLTVLIPFLVQLHPQVAVQGVLQRHRLERLEETVVLVVVLTMTKTLATDKELQAKATTGAMHKVVETTLLVVVEVLVLQVLVLVVTEVQVVQVLLLQFLAHP